MRKNYVKLPLLIAALYFGSDLHAQSTQDTVAKENKIEEVVVIGYGTAKKRDLTGSIVKVSGGEVADKPASNPLNSLQGKVSGLSVVNSGQPGSQADVRIRGTVTVNGVNPVYIVDGAFSNNIDFVNPADIESMEVLKDPSSLAIFGSRAANGAIIITTKRGRSGKTSVSLNSSIGVKTFDNRPDLVDANGFKTLYNEDLANQGVSLYNFSPFSANTNWIDEIAKKGGIINQNNITVSNGTDKNRMSFSFGYQTEDGSIKNEKYDRMTFKFNDDLKITNSLRAGFGLTGSYANLPQLRSFASALNATPVISPINMIPGEYFGLYNSLPQQLGAAQIGNPLAVVEGMKNTQINKDFQFNPNIYFEFDFFRNFTFRSNYFVNYRNGYGRGYTPVFDVYITETNTSSPYSGNLLTNVNQFENRDISFQQNQLLTYKNSFGKSDLTLMLGFETVNREISNMAGTAKGSLSNPFGQIPNNPRFWYLNSDFVDSTTKTVNTSGYKERQISYFSRMLYSFDNKYMLNASIRRDGSGYLAPGNRFDWFWSVGGAWEVTKESFMSNINVINYLKIKGSYGDLGNQNVAGGRYYGYPVYQQGGTGVFNGNIYPAYVPEFITNPNLKWEHLKSYEFGFESALLNRKLTFEANYYNKKTEGLINSDANAATYYLNAGSIESKGFEFSAGWKDNVSENFSYFLNGNLTTTKTKVLSTLAEGYQAFYGPSIYSQGLPIGAFYGYVVDGLYQSYADILGSPASTIGDVGPGDFKYKDLNGDGKITPEDRTMIGNPTPDFTYGFSIGADYKGFYINADFYGVYGNEVFRDWGNGNSFAPFNYREERLDRWTGPGTSNWEPRSFSGSAYNRENSTYMIEDGSFFRIRNVQIGYNFRKELLNGLNIEGLKVYFNVQNLKTWDHVNGFTPEFGGSATQFGVNTSGYPNPRVASFGISANF